MNQQKNDRILRYALKGNALFSGLSGVVILAARNLLAPELGLPSGADLVPTGISLLLFSAWLTWMSTRQGVPRGHALAAAILDGIWVLGSAAALFGSAGSFSTSGFWMVLVVAIVVAIFADLQFYGLYTSRSQQPRTAG